MKFLLQSVRGCKILKLNRLEQQRRHEKFQIKLLNENKLIISALGNLHYQISREKFEPEPGFQRFEVRIPVRSNFSLEIRYYGRMLNRENAQEFLAIRTKYTTKENLTAH